MTPFTITVIALGVIAVAGAILTIIGPRLTGKEETEQKLKEAV